MGEIGRLVDGLCATNSNAWKIAGCECVEENVEECLTILFLVEARVKVLGEKA